MNFSTNQRGSTLFVTLVVLALLMILGTSTITSSIVDVRIAGNTKETFASFQKADAGINAVVSLIGTANDPFDGTSHANPFVDFDADESPIKDITGLTVSTTLTQSAGACGRSEVATSASKVACEYYEIDSAHASATSGANNAVVQGMRRQVIAN